jgi:hypothetical protein
MRGSRFDSCTRAKGRYLEAGRTVDNVEILRRGVTGSNQNLAERRRRHDDFCPRLVQRPKQEIQTRVDFAFLLYQRTCPLTASDPSRADADPGATTGS